MKYTLLFFIFFPLAAYSQCWDVIGTGHHHVVAVANNGTLWGWGLDNYGQLNADSGNISYYPIQLNSDTDWVYADAGATTTYAIKSDGTLWVSGRNNQGQCGLGFSSLQVPQLTQLGTDTDWASVSSSVGTAFAIKTDGTLWGWGSNLYFQVGNGTNLEQTFPVQIGTDTNWVKVSPNSNHTVALKSNGTLWAWGDNSDGQLGIGNYIDKSTPQQVLGGATWVSATAGNSFSTALRNDGTIWSWGSNAYGRLGVPTNTLGDPILKSAVPLSISTSNDWVSISGESIGHTLAVKADGSMWGWGYNPSKQVGNGTNINQTSPVQIGLPAQGWQDVLAGFTYSIAIKTDGNRYSWGQGEFGQLGYLSGDSVALPQLQACPSALSTPGYFNDLPKIYPNPTSSLLHVPNQEGTLIITIFDLTGKIVYKKTTSENSIEVSQLTAGAYFIKLENQDNSWTEKFIKI